jgi:hypothetical protein
MLRRVNEESRVACRHGVIWMIALGTLLNLSLFTSAAQCGNIFDENTWMPPKAAKPAQAPDEVASTSSTKPNTAVRPPPVAVTQPTVTAPPLLHSIPSKAEQARYLEMFREVFAAESADHSAGGRRTLALKLLKQADDDADVAADEFVLLVGAIEAAKQASDLSLCSVAAGKLAAGYGVDGPHVKSDAALAMSLRSNSPAATAENCKAGLVLVDELVACEDYPTAARILQALRAATADAEMTAQIQNRSKDLAALRGAAERAGPYIQKLKTAPDDPAANAAVGRYLCFFRGDWTHGLPLLAKGDRARVVQAADLDLAGANEPQKETEIGDTWWNLAEKEPGPERLAMRRRAAIWYSTALKSDTITGLARALLQKRVADAEMTVIPNTINLLALINPSKDSINGHWSLQDGELHSDEGIRSRIAIPYMPPAEYDFRIELTRVSGGPSVVQILGTAGHRFAWIACWGDNLRGFEVINGRDANDNATTVKGSRFLEKAQRYISVVQVRKNSVAAYIDGKLITKYATDGSDLTLKKE